MGSTLGGILLVAGIVERWLVPVGGRAPGCRRACPSLGRLLAFGGWRDCLAVRVPVAVGAGVAAGVRVLHGRGLGFALLVGGGLPPRR